MVHMDKYMPVAVATSGLSPTIMKPEPKTIPGASPQKEHNKEPRKEQIITRRVFWGDGMKSPSRN